MTEAKQRESWARTASLMSLIANAHRDPKKTRAFKPSDFDPFTKRKNERINLGTDISILKRVFVDRDPHVPISKE